jgi:hypothetical protein
MSFVEGADMLGVAVWGNLEKIAVRLGVGWVERSETHHFFEGERRRWVDQLRC